MSCGGGREGRREGGRKREREGERGGGGGGRLFQQLLRSAQASCVELRGPCMDCNHCESSGKGISVKI
jgi:hypothetical protein